MHGSLRRLGGLVMIVGLAFCFWYGRSEEGTPPDSAPSTQQETSASTETSQEKEPVVVSARPQASQDALLDTDKWQSRMPLPSAGDVDGFSTSSRSPYLVCSPQFEGTTGFTEYAVDFVADAQPTGTYLCVCNFDMDMSDLQSRYHSVYREYSGVAGYAGFQVLADGSKVAIMSIWDTYLQDANGNVSTLRAEKTYPDNPRVYGEFGGEGVGVQCIVPYEWKKGTWYRALIQCQATASGTCELLFYVMDLETGTWTELIAYDTGYANTYLTRPCVFLEDFLTETAGAVRTMELRNFRAFSINTSAWVAATQAYMAENFEYPGSYNYGSDGDAFWAITTGIPSLCAAPPQSAAYSVSGAASGSPY